MLLNFLQAAFSFVFAVGVLSTVHELGHFCFARFFRVKVNKFSIGFGPSIFSWFDKHGTEFSISMIPLGGYVSMLDSSCKSIPATDRSMSLEAKPLYARTIIILAGPVANFLFAIFAYWIVFSVGFMATKPILGSVPQDSIADYADLKEGQLVVSIDGENVRTWEDIGVEVADKLGDRDNIIIETVDSKGGKTNKHSLNMAGFKDSDDTENILFALGLRRYDPLPAVVGKLLPGYPAEKSKLQPGDTIIAANGNTIKNRAELFEYVKVRANEDVLLKVQRDEGFYNIHVVPAVKLEDGGHEIGFLGISFEDLPWPTEMLEQVHYGLGESLVLAAKKTYNYTVVTYKFIYRMAVGEMSLKYLSGPVTIANYAGQTARFGWQTFLNFLALISISLGALNLLPIPMLDGGHLLYNIVEFISGKPVPAGLEQFGYKIGVIAIGGLMILALYNDFARIF